MARRVLTDYQYKQKLVKLENQLRDLRQYDRDLFEEAYKQVRAFGGGKARPLSGKAISKRIGKKALIELEEQLQGGFNLADIKRADKKQFKRYKTENPQTKIKTIQEYRKMKSNLNKLMSEVFNLYSSEQARSIYDEVVLYDDDEQAIEILRGRLEESSYSKKLDETYGLTPDEFIDLWS